ncbi:MAG: glycosyltransferase [Burkholderiaceae bacterium]
MKPDAPAPFCSLILATGGRHHELFSFVESLAAQTERDFELILVDQNPDERTLPAVARAREAGIEVLHLYQAEANLAAARNLGVAHARARWLAFPDDDCWYEPDTLAALRRAVATQAEGYVGTWVEMDSPFEFRRQSLDVRRWRKLRGEAAPSICLFVDRALVNALDGFDPRLGVGQWYGAGEETDFVMRALEVGARLEFAPAITVHHAAPETLPPLSRAVLAQHRSRARGAGSFYARHRLSPLLLLRGMSSPPLRFFASSPLTGLIQGAAVSWGMLEGYLRWRTQEDVFGRGGVTLLSHTLSRYRWGTLSRLAETLGGMRALLAHPPRGREAAQHLRHVATTRYNHLRARGRLPGGGARTGDIPLNLFRLLWRQRPAVVISSELGGRTAIAALARRVHVVKRLAVHLDVNEYSEAGVSLFKGWWRRRLLARADAVIVNGASGERYLHAVAPRYAKAIYRLPYATEAAFLASGARRLAAPESPDDAAHPDANGTLRLVYVGQLVPGKGLEPFIRRLAEVVEGHSPDTDPALNLPTQTRPGGGAAAPAPSRPVVLTLIGGGPETAGLRELAEALALNGSHLRVVHKGPMAHDALPGTLCQHDVLVLPSESETWGMVINEAMACGLPVLASTRAQAVEELVHDRRNGWCFDPLDDTDTRTAIGALLATPARRLRRMRRAAHLTAATLSEARVARHMHEVILAVAPRDASGAPLSLGLSGMPKAAAATPDQTPAREPMRSATALGLRR